MSNEKKVYLKASNGKYLSTTNEGSIAANRDAAVDWEVFKFEDQGNGKTAIRAWNGYFLLAQGDRIVASFRTAPVAEGLFEIQQSGDSVQIKAPDGRFVSATDSAVNLSSEAQSFTISDVPEKNDIGFYFQG
eukprot:TRINITY_DN3885_c0_g1_i1.p1 TRINITY_DN3885_c0_g1~~TRINITY_DN3885_c0_g1_i1.p1  ORF type:complete len:132 (-),score=42.18 TRINITY_DN3885_c0_g1_i1:82-477(-)